MISFADGQALIDAHPMTCSHALLPVERALGFYLAQTVFAPMDLPPFANSAVDGFAVNTESLLNTNELPVLSSLRACAQEEFLLPPNAAVKIMTGAPVPHGANAVVMKEDVTLNHDRVLFNTHVQERDHVRFAGEDLTKGVPVASYGACVTPQLLAVLLGLGIDRVAVVKPPRVVILSTGDELVPAGQPLLHGQVYFLVGPMLKAQCVSLGISDVTVVCVADCDEQINAALAAALEADVVLVTGGMSKGDHDLVRPALQKNHVAQIFYQGAWRPGKPLFFGARGNTHVFGLPGNPVAAFVCFEIFVRRFLKNAFKAPLESTKAAILLNDYQKKAGFTFFVRAHVNEKHELTILPGQGSHQIFSLSRANALCVVNPEKAIVKAGEVVQYYPI